jgi:hypothetical protein
MRHLSLTASISDTRSRSWVKAFLAYVPSEPKDASESIQNLVARCARVRFVFDSSLSPVFVFFSS